MKWVAIGIGVLVGLVAVVIGIGALLPREHQVSRQVLVHQPPGPVWSVLTDYAAAPTWRPDIKSVERLPDHEGRQVWREVDERGDAIPYETVAAEPNRRLVRRIADPDLPFGGTWTFDLAPDAGRTRVTITEQGFVGNPFYRFVSVVVIGHTSYMDAYLENLGRKFGEDVEPATVGSGEAA